MGGVTSTAARATWSDRLGALSGAAYVLLILVGNQLAEGAGSDSHLSGAQVLAHVNDQVDSAAATIGLGMEILGFVAFAFFIAWFWRVLRRGPASWLADVSLIGGVTTLAVKMASGAPAVTLAADRKLLDAQSAMLLNDIGSAAFVVSFITFGIFMLGAGLAILRSRLLGRFAGWSAVVLGAAGIGLTVATQGDPVESNPLPFLLGLVWVLVVSIRLAVRRPHAVSDDSQPMVVVPATSHA